MRALVVGLVLSVAGGFIMIQAVPSSTTLEGFLITLTIGIMLLGFGGYLLYGFLSQFR